MSPTASGRGRGLALLLLSGLLPGVALADVAAERWLPRETSEALLDAVGGEAETLWDMTSTADCPIGQRLQDLEALNAEMAILSVAGVVGADDALSDHLSHTFPILYRMRLEGLESDGLVPLGSAILPFSDYVVFRGTDHTALVSGGLLGRSLEETALTTQALLAIVLAAPRTTETLQ